MSKDFILPDIGEGIVECEVIEWKVKEGDLIEEDQVVVDVSTDKAIVEIPSMYNGRVTKLYYAEGDIAKVHGSLFAIEIEGAEEAVVSAEGSLLTEGSPSVVSAEKPAPANQSTVLTTPAVRKMAREHDLDLGTITGSGKQGRVLKEDVLDFLSVDPELGQVAPLSTGIDRVEPIRGVRKLMAERMATSVASIPHFTYVDEIDITELAELRQTLKNTYATDDLKITMMPLFIKALSLAIKEFPIINSSPNEDLTELTYRANHNIGLAVDGKTGLLVPNIKNVEQLGILDVAREVTRLVDAARSGKISPADLKGGTITISNIGAIGGTVATPIINMPEVAIAALGKIQQLPRFDDEGNVVSRSIMNVSWSGDHRVIDGGTIARFCNLWKSYLEVPSTMLTAMV
jgi:2-oxoisovalerate dehydrogenase E2 component (dihydrolipoyl transacylase)